MDPRQGNRYARAEKQEETIHARVEAGKNTSIVAVKTLDQGI